LNGHNFLNLDPKIFVLVPENREFISLQENIKKILVLMMPKYSKTFRLGPFSKCFEYFENLDFIIMGII